jgi:hypothetical protein
VVILRVSMGKEKIIVPYTLVPLKKVSKNRYERIPNCLYATGFNNRCN